MTFYGKSDVGAVRQNNQDSFSIIEMSDSVKLCIVCDGMGGAKSGNVASECAIEAFIKYFRKKMSSKIDGDGNADISNGEAKRILEGGVKAANTAVYKMSKSDSVYEGMGTTLVAGLFTKNCAYIANVGDSRLYMIKGSEMTQITHDHSYVQYLVDSGALTEEEAKNHPYKNRITNAVGIKNDTDADIFMVDIQSDESCWFLLCSDGLSGMLDDEELLEIITAPSECENELTEKTELLINKANEAGGRDNITAILGKYTVSEEIGNGSI